jgi:hypothetical protein
MENKALFFSLHAQFIDHRCRLYLLQAKVVPDTISESRAWLLFYSLQPSNTLSLLHKMS